MSGFETRFRADDGAELIRTAFYGFVGAHAEGIDGDAHIRTEIDGTGQRILVRLWSAEALAAFLASLSGPSRQLAHE